MDASAEWYGRIAAAILYISISLIACRWLIPRLSPAGRALASVMLAAQALVAGAALFIEFPSGLETWLFHLNHERNIPAILSSLQMALVGFVALLIAWKLKRQPTWRLLYYVALGILFLFLAYDEYFALHEYLSDWIIVYGSVGALAALATLLVAWRSPRNTLKWHAILLIGLGLSATGAMLVPLFRDLDLCARLVFWTGNECMLFDFEESLELLGIWLTLVALLGQLLASPPLPSVRFHISAVAFSVSWLFFLYYADAFPPFESYPAHANIAAAHIEYESGIRLHGYRIAKHLHFFLSPGSFDFGGRGFNNLGYSVDLVDQVSGLSVLSRKQYVHRQFWVVTGSRYQPIYRQWIDLDRPSTLPVNHAYWIVLTLWREDGDIYRRQEIVVSDHELLNDTQVILGEMVVPSISSTDSSDNDPQVAFDNGFILDGFVAPERAGAGRDLSINFSWRSQDAGSEDHQQFLHLFHEESGEFWVHDQQPLGARLPTRLWYAGMADSETWQVPLPADLDRGRYRMFTGLYRLRDLERVPAKSVEGIYFADARVPLGSLEIE